MLALNIRYMWLIYIGRYTIPPSLRHWWKVSQCSKRIAKPSVPSECGAGRVRVIPPPCPPQSVDLEEITVVLYSATTFFLLVDMVRSKHSIPTLTQSSQHLQKNIVPPTLRVV